MRRLPRAVLAPLLGASMCLVFATASAQDWDPAAFAELLGAAEDDYVAGNYAGAADKYARLRTSLQGALSSGAIDARQEDAAREALAVITYQLGRSQQETGACDAAGETYAALETQQDLSASVRVKLPARLGEARLCAASKALDQGQLDEGWTRLSGAATALSSASSEAIARELDAKQASELESALTRSRSELDALEARYLTARTEAARGALATGDCSGASAQLAALESTHAEREEVATLRTDVAACDDGPTFEEVEPWLAIGLMGVGGALLVTTVVLEIAIADDVDAYPRERERCLSGTSVACSGALELSDDIRTQQIVTGTLIGVGLVALGGGLAWYLLSSDDDAADASEVMLAPSVGRHGGQLELTVRF